MVGSSESNNVFSLAAHRIRLALSRGRVPLTSTHSPEDSPDMAARIERIKASLNRINLIMAELKEQGAKKKESNVIKLQEGDDVP